MSSSSKQMGYRDGLVAGVHWQAENLPHTSGSTPRYSLKYGFTSMLFKTSSSPAGAPG